jgi:hypothetical protein
LQPITDDDVDRIATCIRVVADQSQLLFHIFNEMCRQSLSVMLSVKVEEDKEFQKVFLAELIMCVAFCWVYAFKPKSSGMKKYCSVFTGLLDCSTHLFVVQHGMASQ